MTVNSVGNQVNRERKTNPIAKGAAIGAGVGTVAMGGLAAYDYMNINKQAAKIHSKYPSMDLTRIKKQALADFKDMTPKVALIGVAVATAVGLGVGAIVKACKKHNAHKAENAV